MLIQFDPSAFRRTPWSEYALRFVVGGLITAGAGVIARRYGPGVGGLFLAFPAIFPAAATLIEKRQKKKERYGMEGSRRGGEAVSLEAAGAARGCIALAGFALAAWLFLPDHRPTVALGVATFAWIVLSGAMWESRHVCHRLRRKHNSKISGSGTCSGGRRQYPCFCTAVSDHPARRQTESDREAGLGARRDPRRGHGAGSF